MKPLELEYTSNPDASFVREIEKLRAKSKVELADAIVRARLAWGKR